MENELDDIEDNPEYIEWLKSEQFGESINKIIERDTWEQGLPKIYMDKEGWLVKHWKDGKIEKIKKIK